MTKQEEIREDVAKTFHSLQSEFEPLKEWGELDSETKQHFLCWADKVLEKQASKGVVIKVDMECDHCHGTGKHNFYSTTYKSDIDTVCNYCKGEGSLKVVESLIEDTQND